MGTSLKDVLKLIFHYFDPVSLKYIYHFDETKGLIGFKVIRSTSLMVLLQAITSLIFHLPTYLVNIVP